MSLTLLLSIFLYKFKAVQNVTLFTNEYYVYFKPTTGAIEESENEMGLCHGGSAP